MTKEQRIEKVKDLLNQVVALCGTNTDEFLENTSDTVKDLLKDESEDDNSYSSSEEYYDSNC